MPIYEYICEKCNETFEVTRSITAAPLKKHGGASKCGGKVRKLMSSNSFHLKGTGWYKTDYATPPKDKGKKAEKAGKAPEAKEPKKTAAVSSDS